MSMSMDDPHPQAPPQAAEAEDSAPDRAAGWRARFLLVVGALLLALGVAEGGLRLLGVGGVMTFVPDDRWGYLMTPERVVYAYGHPVATDARGLRAPLGREALPPTALRILFVGDSVTYGGGRLREEELFCRRVESALLAEGLAVRCVNLSAPGWGPQNWRGYIEAEGLLGADIVVLVLPDCDLARPFATMAMHGFREKAPLTRVGAVLGKTAGLLRPRDPYAGHDPDLALRDNLAAVRWLRGRVAGEAELLVVFVPGRPDVGGSPHWPRFREIAPGALELGEALADAGLYLDPIHLNAAGHAEVAEHIFRRLRSMPGLSSRRPPGPPGRATACVW